LAVEKARLRHVDNVDGLDEGDLVDEAEPADRPRRPHSLPSPRYAHRPRTRFFWRSSRMA